MTANRFGVFLGKLFHINAKEYDIKKSVALVATAATACALIATPAHAADAPITV